MRDFEPESRHAIIKFTKVNLTVICLVMNRTNLHSPDKQSNGLGMKLKSRNEQIKIYGIEGFAALYINTLGSSIGPLHFVPDKVCNLSNVTERRLRQTS